MSDFYVFVHLPKTGGTSLRVAAARKLGHERILYDYGRRERLTSELVLEWVYDRKHPAGLAAAAQEGGYRFLSGHFPVTRYRDAFAGAKFLTWMREPRQRVWSAFRHYRRNNGFEGSLEDFYRTPEHCNVQSRFMAGDPALFDFIGVLEHNDRSLDLLARSTGLELPEGRTNAAPDDDRPSAPTAGDWRNIGEFNREDAALYERVVRRYSQAS